MDIILLYDDICSLSSRDIFEGFLDRHVVRKKRTRAHKFRTERCTSRSFTSSTMDHLAYQMRKVDINGVRYRSEAPSMLPTNTSLNTTPSVSSMTSSSVNSESSQYQPSEPSMKRSGGNGFARSRDGVHDLSSLGTPSLSDAPPRQSSSGDGTSYGYFVDTPDHW